MDTKNLPRVNCNSEIPSTDGIMFMRDGLLCRSLDCGLKLTRGEFGDVYRSQTACVWDWRDNKFRHAYGTDIARAESTEEFSWMVWDSTYGWL